MAIVTVSTSNTFNEWRVVTNQLVTEVNKTESGTAVLVANTITANTITANSDVTVSGNTSITGTLGVTGNVTLSGELRGPATFTIDPAAVGDNTGTVVIKGNLQVDGTTTTINSTTLTVDDLNIVLADGAANAAAANGAGITISGASATITYLSSGDKFSINKAVDFAANPILTGGTANGVAYLNSSKVLTTGSSFAYDGTRLTISANAALPSAGSVAGTNLWTVGADATTNAFLLDAFGSNSTLVLRRASGTSASPTAVTSGSSIANIGARGYGATGYSSGNRASINMSATETWTDSAQGTRIAFNTTLNGSATLSERVSIENTGDVIVNGGAVINESGGDYDFRVESDTNTHMLFIDASTDRIGINKSNLSGGAGVQAISGILQMRVGGNNTALLLDTGVDYAGLKINSGAGNASGSVDSWEIAYRPSYSAGVASAGDVSAFKINSPYGGQNEIVINEDGSDIDFRVESDTNTSAFFIDGATGYVSIGTTAPARQLVVYATNPTLQLTDSVAGLTAGAGAILQHQATNQNLAIRTYDTASGNGAISFQTGGAYEKMRITNTGRVGIGITDPLTTTHIVTGGANGLVVEPIYYGGGGGESALADSANTVYNLTLRSAYGASAGSVSNGGHKWGILLTGYNGSSVGASQLAKSAGLFAVSEETDGGYNRKVGMSLWTSPFDGNIAERVRITHEGKVGIGKTNPSQILDVNGTVAIGTTAGGGSVNIGTSSGGSQYQYINFGGGIAGDDAWQIGRSPAGGISSNAFYIYDLKNNVNRVALANTGFLGIGTTSPGARLNVVDSGSTNTSITDVVRIFYSATNTPTVGYGAGIALQTANSSVPGSPQTRVVIAGVAEAVTASSEKTALVVTTPASAGSGSQTERFRITSDGRVGIGITNPSSQLHSVGGNATFVRDGAVLQIQNYVYSSGQTFHSPRLTTWRARGTEASPSAVQAGDELASWEVSGYNASSGWTYAAGIRMYATGTISGGNVPSYITFDTSNGSTGTEKVRIDNNGRVGIGVTAPSQLLHIKSGGGSAAYVQIEAPSYDTLTLGVDSAVARFESASTTPIVFRINGAEKMRITNGSGIGIGTTSPSYALHVVGDIYHSGNRVDPNGFKTKNFEVGGRGNTRTRCEIAQITRDINDWGYAYFEVIVRHKYYNSGGYSRYQISYGYSVGGVISCLDAEGASPVRVYLGSEVTVSGDIRYTPVYLDLPEYYIVDVQFTYASGMSEISSGTTFTNYDQIKFPLTYSDGSGSGNFNYYTTRHYFGGGMAIGTTAPTAWGTGNNKLVLAGSSGGTYVDSAGTTLTIDGNGTNTPITFYARYSNNFRLQSDSFITFGTGSSPTERVRITSTGDVGIGTTAPGAPLQVNSTRTSSTSQATIILSDTVTGSQTDGVYKSIRSISNGGSSISEIRFIETDGTNNNTALGFVTAPTAGSLIERMRINNNGNVGINRTVLPANGGQLIVRASGPHASNTYFAMRVMAENYSDSGNYTTMIGMGVESGTWSKGAIGYTRQAAYDVGSIAFYLNSASTTDMVTIADEKMRLDYNGNLGIGTTAPSTRLHVRTAGAHGILLAQDTGTSANSARLFFAQETTTWCILNTGGGFSIRSGATAGSDSGTEKFSLNTSGNLSITGTLTENSSIALKENVNPITNALDYISQLVGVTYDRKDGSAKNRAGLIKEEVEKVLPNVVNDNGIQYTNIIAYLVESIKDLKKEIEDLKKGN